ncbi:mycofactocin system FadH/OYE family oxidoreductase 1 [Cryptosporangium phraense]|uniref:Mycofactocin system FadH/OYE family oxidoreductase 1 n=1 Tax=Cryptosporangium phraense TaxID=2593070 RepID=A0A545AMS7_9ACTN|nr:mycofactocin system FadH/OYE family oxidoreductase 1 [Cryptosporangium phraense]TQS42628.1 mycofactocin system FadH/OYE family oxidoreductase 1 [Cryptosporangium phraense]
MLLTEPVGVAGVLAPSRVVFGPHETNLARGRALGDRARAYYAERAAGGTGVLVTEVASVTPDDWPYERAPLASECAEGWAAIAAACRPYGTLVLAGLGHAGLQGSSAYSQDVLRAPSPVADVVTREQPAAMEQPDIDAVVAGFGAAAALAAEAGLAGVELNAGPHSLLRQFLSGLTNLRSDAYGTDRSRFLRDVIASVRAAAGPDRVLALRLSGDEDAPWAGLTPADAYRLVDELAGTIDLLTVVRAGHYSSSRYRPTARTEPGFNRELCRSVRAVAAGRVPVVLQGSVVDAGMAQDALDDGTADLVEMTRAQIAEPRLVALVRAGAPNRARPCLLCNQACQVRDVRNPLVSCVVEPRAGHELDDDPPASRPGPGDSPEVLVVGGGPAGLEAARTLALLGRRVHVAERSAVLGGALRTAAAGPGRERLALLVDWLAEECRRLGVRMSTERTVTPADVHGTVILATGSRPANAAGTVDVLDVLSGAAELPSGAVVLDDPVGGPVAVALAEQLASAGRTVHVVTPDPVLGARTPELADANFRLEALGVHRALRSRVAAIRPGEAELEHVWTGERRTVACAAVVDCGHRRPDETFAEVDAVRAGDCVAPRTVLEAVLEGRRAAFAIVAPPSRASDSSPQLPAGHRSRVAALPV